MAPFNFKGVEGVTLPWTQQGQNQKYFVMNSKDYHNGLGSQTASCVRTVFEIRANESNI